MGTYIKAWDLLMIITDKLIMRYKILHEVKNGNMSLQNAEQVLVENIEAIKYFSTSHDSTMKTLHRFVDSDHARAKRTGFPEVIFGKGKTGEQISLIFDDMAGHVNE